MTDRDWPPVIDLATLRSFRDDAPPEIVSDWLQEQGCGLVEALWLFAREGLPLGVLACLVGCLATNEAERERAAKLREVVSVKESIDKLIAKPNVAWMMAVPFTEADAWLVADHAGSKTAKIVLRLFRETTIRLNVYSVETPHFTLRDFVIDDLMERVQLRKERIQGDELAPMWWQSAVKMTEDEARPEHFPRGAMDHMPGSQWSTHTPDIRESLRLVREEADRNLGIGPRWEGIPLLPVLSED